MRLISTAIWILVAFTAAFIGGRARPGEWYLTRKKPSWNPPNWVFAPVWTLLFILMGLSAGMIWEERSRVTVTLALGLFLAQLAANALWSWLFFGWHQMGWALLELLLLWGLILGTILSFWAVRPLAGQLLLPYLAWVSFAGVLNLALWRLNRADA